MTDARAFLKAIARQIQSDIAGSTSVQGRRHTTHVIDMLERSAIAGQIREHNRAMYRREVGQPGMKWRMFKEQCRREQRELDFREKQEQDERQEPSKAVQNALKRLRYQADRRAKDKGGRAASMLRKLFIHWDHDSSGMLSKRTLTAAFTQLGVPISEQDADEVLTYYSTTVPPAKKGREIAHADLLQDAVKGAPDLLEIGQGATGRLLGSSRSEGSLLGKSSASRTEGAVIKAFRGKLQQVVDKRAQDVGGAPPRILRGLFRKWDQENSGTISTDRLRGALRSLNMRVSVTQAQAVERFYARGDSPHAECDYMALVRDVCGPDRGPIVHRIEELQRQERDMGQVAADLIGVKDCGKGSARSSVSGEEISFTWRPQAKPRNRVVEKFRLRLRDALEKTIKKQGGVPHAIIREAFLKWDADASGKLDPRELVEAVKEMGVLMTADEAKATVAFYDVDGSGEMDYSILWKEIKPLSHPMLSYVEEVDVLNGLLHEIEVPPTVSSALERIRAGVVSAGRRAARGCSSSLPPIAPKDLLMGTCLRFDRKDTGVLRADQLQQVWRELKVNMRRSETAALVAWFDRGAADALRPADLCRSVFGEEIAVSARPCSRRKDEPLPSPPKPHMLQAQRAAALAMGKSCKQAFTASASKTNGGDKTYGAARASTEHACPPLPPGRTRGDDCRVHKRRAPYFENETAWNWQGLPPAGTHRSVSGCPQRLNVVTKAEVIDRGNSIEKVGHLACQGGGGGCLGAERARIQRRLKELQAQRLRLLCKTERKRAGDPSGLRAPIRAN